MAAWQYHLLLHIYFETALKLTHNYPDGKVLSLDTTEWRVLQSYGKGVCRGSNEVRMVILLVW